MSTVVRRDGRQFALVLAALGGLITASSWTQYRYAIRAVEHEARESAWLDLEACGRAILNEHPAVVAAAQTTTEWAAVGELLAANRSTHGGVIVVDEQWHVLGRWGAGHALHANRPAGDVISWMPSGDRADDGGASRRGRIRFAGVEYLAVLCSLPGGSRRLVVYLPLEEIEAHRAFAARVLPGITLIGGLWLFVLLGIVAYVVWTHLRGLVKRERKCSEARNLRDTQALVQTRDAVIFGLAKLAESRDPDTGRHLERISNYSTILASALRQRRRYRDVVTPAFVKLIGISSALHDIGKVGIDDRALLKPGPLTSEERLHMQHHTVIGGSCLLEIEGRLGSTNFLQMAREIAFSHHERWDGTGCPEGLIGKEIPLSARIVAIADVYDALRSTRSYKEPLPHTQCVEIIRREAGAHFDPELVEVWLTVEQRFRDISELYATPGPLAPAAPPLPETQGMDEEERDAAAAGLIDP
jgi:HD-GYP domain-containing protein (c-di-GMP phosphodiesterase class II)